jgi:hypothetical protein
MRCGRRDLELGQRRQYRMDGAPLRGPADAQSFALADLEFATGQQHQQVLGGFAAPSLYETSKAASILAYV